MTINYSLKVSTVGFCAFARLLARWRGSVYQLIWREFLIYIGVYYAILCTYRWGMSPWHQSQFGQFAAYCTKFTNAIPLTFVLGFYVSLVIGRWWEQYRALPWPDRTCYFLAAYIKGTEE